MNWIVYLVECKDKSLYCGITNNIERRLSLHNSGRGAKYTRERRPVILMQTSKEMSKSEVLKLERRVKKQRKDKKIDYLKQYV